VIKEEELQPNYSLRDAIEKFSKSKENKEPIELVSIPLAIKSNSNWTIKEVSISHVQQGIGVLVDAFYHDPWIQYFLPEDGPSKTASLKWFLGIVIEYGVKHGRVWGAFDNATSKLLGIAVWQTPFETGVSFWNLLRLGMASAPFQFGIGPTWRMMSCLDLTEKVHSQVISEPHWALYTIGVMSHDQSKGIGSALIAPMLSVVDSDKFLFSHNYCYVDTSSERSLGFFQKHGFEIVNDVSNPSKGPRFWSLLREPKWKA